MRTADEGCTSSLPAPGPVMSTASLTSSGGVSTMIHNPVLGLQFGSDEGIEKAMVSVPAWLFDDRTAARNVHLPAASVQPVPLSGALSPSPVLSTTYRKPIGGGGMTMCGP